MGKMGCWSDHTRSHSQLTKVSALIGLSIIGLGAAPMAMAQEVDRGTSITNLPRPGYEPRNLRFGSTIVAPQLTLQGLYDSNVFATSSNAADDFILSIAPRVDATSEFGSLRLKTDAYVTHGEYVDHGSESRTTFGGGTKGDFAINRANRLSFGVRFDRQVESRADPEGNLNPFIKPRKINALSGDLGYRYQMNRIGIALAGGIDKQDYLSPADAERDMTTYRGSLRVSVQVSGGTDVFVQGFINRRDNRLAVDFSGIDRDATTVGALAGISLDLSNQWRGDMGFGVFRNNSDDPTIKSFTGFAANGKLTWSPDERTAVSLAVFRGDVGTVRSGVSGRIDTRVSLQLEQEIRHNLLFFARTGVRQTTYRGAPGSQRQTTGMVGAEAEYLLNRYMSVFVTGDYNKRWSKLVLERFEKSRVGLGLRLKY